MTASWRVDLLKGGGQLEVASAFVRQAVPCPALEQLGLPQRRLPLKRLESALPVQKLGHCFHGHTASISPMSGSGYTPRFLACVDAVAGLLAVAVPEVGAQRLERNVDTGRVVDREIEQLHQRPPPYRFHSKPPGRDSFSIMDMKVARIAPAAISPCARDSAGAMLAWASMPTWAVELASGGPLAVPGLCFV